MAARAARPSEMTAFHPASESPRKRQAASVQLTTRVAPSWFRKSPTEPGAAAGTPAQSLGPCHQPHSTPAVIGAEPGADEEDERQQGEPGPHQAGPRRERRRQRDRHGGVIGPALLEAEGARPEPPQMLEGKRPRDRGDGGGEDQSRRSARLRKPVCGSSASGRLRRGNGRLRSRARSPRRGPPAPR